MKHIRSVRIGCDGGVCPPSLVAPHQPWKLQLLRHFFQTKQRNFAKLNSKELFLFLHFGYLKTSESHPSAPFHICFLCVAPPRITVPAHCSATSRLMIFSQEGYKWYKHSTQSTQKSHQEHQSSESKGCSWTLRRTFHATLVDLWFNRPRLNKSPSQWAI